MAPKKIMGRNRATQKASFKPNHKPFAFSVKVMKQQSLRLFLTQHVTYETRKTEWLARNLGANSEDYEAAMQRIAYECGV